MPKCVAGLALLSRQLCHTSPCAPRPTIGRPPLVHSVRRPARPSLSVVSRGTRHVLFIKFEFRLHACDSLHHQHSHDTNMTSNDDIRGMTAWHDMQVQGLTSRKSGSEQTPMYKGSPETLGPMHSRFLAGHIFAHSHRIYDNADT